MTFGVLDSETYRIASVKSRILHLLAASALAGGCTGHSDSHVGVETGADDAMVDAAVDAIFASWDVPGSPGIAPGEQPIVAVHGGRELGLGLHLETAGAIFLWAILTLDAVLESSTLEGGDW